MLELLGITFSATIYIIFCLMTVIFFILYVINRTRMLNGLLFMIWLLTFIFTMLYAIFQLNNAMLNGIVYVLALSVSIGVMVLMMLSPFAVTFGLFINAWIVYRKEKSLHLSNMLTLMVAILFSIIYIVSWFVQRHNIPLILQLILKVISIIQTYVSLYFINFIVTAVIYRFYWPNYNKDYLVVLGSGLIDGHIVSPLLASRIDKAIAFYDKARKKGYTLQFIFSGGQGIDEHLPEAQAMKMYALQKGIPEEHILVECQSTNTYENMLFSKQLMTKERAKVMFFTNNFHVFRSALYARQAKLNAIGIGSKTALYFLPNAIILEFIAIVNLHKKKHMILLTLITFFYLVGVFVSYRYIWFS